MRALVGLALSLSILLSLAKATTTMSAVEDWSAHPIGSAGVPGGWTAESFGRRAFYDLTVEADGDVRALHLKSRDEHSTISKDIGGKVVLRDTPILEWTWKVTILPVGGDL